MGISDLKLLSVIVGLYILNMILKSMYESFQNFEFILQFLQDNVKVLQCTLFFHQSFRK